MIIINWNIKNMHPNFVISISFCKYNFNLSISCRIIIYNSDKRTKTSAKISILSLWNQKKKKIHYEINFFLSHIIFVLIFALSLSENIIILYISPCNKNVVP